jgi:DNA-binding protein HU-beta
MKKRELIQAVAIHTDVDNKTAAKLVEGTIDVILATVAKGDVVNISGFAKFAKIKRPARIGRNPATGEQIKIAAKTVAKVTALKGFKDIGPGTEDQHQAPRRPGTGQEGGGKARSQEGREEGSPEEGRQEGSAQEGRQEGREEEVILRRNRIIRQKDPAPGGAGSFRSPGHARSGPGGV